MKKNEFIYWEILRVIKPKASIKIIVSFSNKDLRKMQMKNQVIRFDSLKITFIL